MSEWLDIESAPKDETRIIGVNFGRYGDGGLWAVWWQPEFEAWISSAREMVMAEGYTFNGKSRHLHSPEKREPTHWMPLPKPPAAISKAETPTDGGG